MPSQQTGFLEKIGYSGPMLVTHLLTTFTIAGGLIVWGMGITSRVSVIESRQDDLMSRIVVILENQRIIDARQDAAMAETRQIIREDVRDINIKLDNVLRMMTTERSQ